MGVMCFDRIEAGIDVLIPNADDVEIINSVIYDELCLGNTRITPSGKNMVAQKNTAITGIARVNM